ncbi:hypothetical protein [Kitasatospora mediocidica]|nr:hypothetical protein [Kitasatospora mediocidica]
MTIQQPKPHLVVAEVSVALEVEPTFSAQIDSPDFQVELEYAGMTVLRG